MKLSGAVGSVMTRETDVELHFGGVRFRPGDWVYCDEDGVLVSPVQIE